MDEQNKAKLIDVEDAQSIILSSVALLPVQELPLLECCGRVLAQDATSDIDISPFDNSAMDGFAVCFEDFAQWKTKGAQEPLCLNIIGRIGAGEVWVSPLKIGEALRIMTGAPMPKGADTVVKIEDTEVIGVSKTCPEGVKVEFLRMPNLGDHIRLKGEEAACGDVLLRKGEVLNPAGIGLLAATGHTKAMVYSKPRVAIISTGDEIVDIETMPGPGQIRNSNSYSIAAQVIEAGGIPTIYPHAKDTFDGLVGSVKEAMSHSDFVITSGGASDGDFDFVAPMVRELGELHFNKVNMKPGKAQVFGMIDGVPLFGLAGNPGAASVGFEIIVRPALLKMQGFTNFMRATSMATTKYPIKKKEEKRRLYLRSRLSKDEAGNYYVTPDKSQSSALLGALSRSNCLLVVPEGDGSLEAGERVKCIRLDVLEGTI